MGRPFIYKPKQCDQPFIQSIPGTEASHSFLFLGNADFVEGSGNIKFGIPPGLPNLVQRLVD